MVPATVLEPVSECFLASLIIGWAAHYVFRYSANHRAERRHPPVGGLSSLGGPFLVLNCGLCLSLRWDMMVFFMCHCLAWFIADYIQLTGVQVAPFHRFILKYQFVFQFPLEVRK